VNINTSTIVFFIFFISPYIITDLLYFQDKIKIERWPFIEQHMQCKCHIVLSKQGNNSSILNVEICYNIRRNKKDKKNNSACVDIHSLHTIPTGLYMKLSSV
jgi:hypothetical protein